MVRGYFIHVLKAESVMKFLTGDEKEKKQTWK